MITTLFTSQEINDVISNPCNTFVATTSGLDIINNNSLENIGYVVFSGGGFTSVYHKSDRCSGVLFLGTTYSGVQKLIIDPISMSGNMSDEIVDAYLAPAKLTSNEVQIITGSNNGDLAIATNSGIDFYKANSSAKVSTYFPGGMTSMFVTEAGDLYYSPVLSGGLYVKYSPINTNWSDPDYKLVAVGGFPTPSGVEFIPSNRINEIQISAAISGGHPCVFLATTSGLFIYEENRSDLSSSISGAVLYRNIP